VRSPSPFAVLVSAAMFGVAPSHAQTLADSIMQPDGFCFRGQALPACRTFAITEFGYGRGLWNDLDETGLGHHVEPHLVFWELGAMRNLGVRSAVGGTFLLTSRASVGLKARYRQWLGAEFSLDLAPGLIVIDDRSSARTPAFTGHLVLNYGDWLSLGAMLETSRFAADPFNAQPATSTTKPYFTLRVGSYPGVISGGAMAALAALAAILIKEGDTLF
jgi:hypothetical protein